MALFLVLCTAGEIRQRILVSQAAALLADMHSLHLRQSDWSDAQRLMTRWGRSGHYDGTCTASDCMYVITLQNGTVPGTNMAEWTGYPMSYVSAFRLLPRQWGGGLRMMQGMFLVQDGRIVRTGMAIDVTPSPLALGAEPECCGAELIMSVRSQASLGRVASWQEEQRSHHPDYTTWRPGGCTFCLMARVTYADSMPAAEAAKLSDFQLSCATRWSSCLTLEELDPAAHAWHLYQSPWGDPPETSEPEAKPVGCPLPVYALGRDAQQIVSVEALEDGKAKGVGADGEGLETTHVKVLAPLKGDSPWKIASIQSVNASGYPFGDGIWRPVHLVKGRRYWVMLDPQEFGTQTTVSLGDCKIVEESAENARELLRGIAMADAIRGFEPTVSLNGFSRDARRSFDF